MAKKKKTTFGQKITILTTLTSVGTIVLLGVSLMIVFVVYLFHNAQKDVEYILDTTNRQFEDKLEFIADGAVSIRRNTVLAEFLEGEATDTAEAQRQLTYAIELMSDRNMVNQIPFVESVYLFNNQGRYLEEHYYPSTVSALKEAHEQVKEQLEEYKRSNRQYAFLQEGEKGKINLYFRMYDGKLSQTGICVVQIQKEAIREIFKGIESYDGSSWMVLDAGGEPLISQENSDRSLNTEALTGDYLGGKRLDNQSLILSVVTCDFQSRAVIGVGQSNVYRILQPTTITFFVILFVALAFAVLLALINSRSMTKHLREMTEEIREFGEQKLDVRMGDFPIVEFQEIGSVFNEMADKMQHLITEVYEKQLLANRSQIKYLQSQINPHFQFNVLAMLAVRAKAAGNEEVYQGLHAFSKLTQGKIFREKESRITVAKELELVEFYLYLQNARYQDKIRYEIVCAQESVREDLIPRLLIEPLVENAVSHGLEPKEGNGVVKMELFETEDKLHIIVEDNGVGFEQAEEERKETEGGSLEAHTGTGIANTKRLLKAIYGENCRMDVSSKKGRGTRIEIILPKEKEHVEGNDCG